MQTTTFSELRRRAKKYLDDVEQGDTVRVTRRGRVIAKIVPADDETKPTWKKPAVRIVIPGTEISKMILNDREKQAK